MIDPLDWIDEVQAGPDVLRAIERQRHGRSRRRLRAAIAGCVMLLVPAIVWQANVRWRERALSAATSAVVKLPSRQILPDGSIVELREGAVVVVAYSSGARRVTLDKGEAHFQVMKSNRPFIVAAKGIAVRAVGTAFLVQLGSTQVEVLVTEGRVAVAADAANESQEAKTSDETPGIDDQEAEIRNKGVQVSASPASFTPALPDGPARLASGPVASLAPMYVDAGNRLLVDLGAGVLPPRSQPVAAVELKKRLAWRVPRLEFSSTSLSDAIPLINEHSRVRLVLADQNLAHMKLSGVLRADNMETLLELLSEEYNITSERRSENEIVLSNRR